MYENPPLNCDLVMKGGITSGVVYPLAICAIAKTYRLHSIGGASAGAIAAAMAAAAEYRRRGPDHSGDGFVELERLPAKLGAPRPGAPTTLSTLFVATPGAVATLQLMRLAISKRGIASKIVRAIGIVAYRHPLLPVTGIVVAAAILRGAGAGWHLAAAVIGAMLSIVAGILGGAALAAIRNYRAIAANGGGVCDGKALTTWLDAQITATAGKPCLTFADLDHADRLQRIRLAMMTTNLSYGRPARLPFDDGERPFFAAVDARRLFPEHVATYLIERGEQLAQTAKLAAIAKANPGLLPLPVGNDLPVIVAVRMSLSFPVLLSAIPLYLADSPNTGFTTRPIDKRTAAPSPHALRRCWFSDGGICSNLPIHFFDALLPRWPTFALSLRPAPANHPVWLADSGKAGSEGDNVWIPENERAGGADNWQLVGDSAGSLGASSLLASMVDTMQNWNDNMLAKAPGYRDRIVLTNLRADEGGLNLDMPDDVIVRLSQRGQAAGEAIATRFGATETGWRDHVWVRYRASLGMLQELLGEAHQAYFAPTSDPELRHTLDELIATPPDWLKLEGNEKAAAEKVNAAFARYNDVSTAEFFSPAPVFELRPRPRSA